MEQHTQSQSKKGPTILERFWMVLAEPPVILLQVAAVFLVFFATAIRVFPFIGPALLAVFLGGWVCARVHREPAFEAWQATTVRVLFSVGIWTATCAGHLARENVETIFQGLVIGSLPAGAFLLMTMKEFGGNLRFLEQAEKV